MKIIQHQYAGSISYPPRTLPEALPVPGAITLQRGNRCISNDFLGFGVALTGSSCYCLSQMSQEERTAFLRSIYSPEGLNLSVARLSIGSSDYSAELYSYDDVPDDRTLSHFSIDRDRAYIIPMIREVLEIRPDLHIFASPWSPPGWMKTGGNLCGGYMRAEYVDLYADYIIRFLEEYEACGIHVSAITPQNESETQQGGRMPACIWHPDTEATFILTLREKLTQKGMDTEIRMYDHNFDGVPRVLWQLQTYPALGTAANGVAFHYYKGAIEDTRPLLCDYPHMKLHFTEGGPRLYDHYETDHCKWATMIAKVLREGYSSFTGWNLMLDEIGGPNIGPFFCGGLVTRNAQTGALGYSGQYRALWHTARFLQKGACVFEVTTTKNTPGMFKYPQSNVPLETAAWENPDGSRVYLLVNPDTDKKQVSFYEGGAWRYAELLPDSVSTIVVEP